MMMIIIEVWMRVGIGSQGNARMGPSSSMTFTSLFWLRKSFGGACDEPSISEEVLKNACQR
jgi:hypothetical protein